MEKNNETKQSFIKNYGICLKRAWSVLLIFSVIGVLLGLLIAHLSYKEKYKEDNLVELNFRYTTEISFDYRQIISNSNIERCKGITKSLETGNKVSTYQYVELSIIEIERKNGYYTITADMNAFNVGKDYAYSDSAAKGFLKHLTLLPLVGDEELSSYLSSEDKGMSVFSSFDKTFYEENSLDSDGKIKILYSNPEATTLNKSYRITYYSIWITGSFGVLFIASLIFVGVFSNKLDITLTHEYDNENIYKTPFHKSLWKKSFKHLKEIKSLCVMSILLAFVMIAKFIPIPSGFGNLGISLGFIFLSVACMLYGPGSALVIGMLSDVIGYLIKPDGMFFIGYTIQSMLACMMYGVCFYKTHITFSKCLIARVFVNFIANVIIGGISWGIISGFTVDQTITYMLTISLPKNLVYLLPQSLVIYAILKALARPMSIMGIIHSDIAENISFF